MTFAYPGLLFLLLLIPGFAFIYVISRYFRKKRLKRFGNPKTLEGLMPDLSPYKSNIRFIISMGALASLIIALARPWGGVKDQETVKEGIEIVIALDASNSMLASATDDEGGINRMRTAKLMLERLINRLNNDRVGLIAFAGDAYTLIPVTNDYVSAKAFLNSVDPSMIPHQGTNIAAAINLAENSFSEKGDIGKAIILLTDAEELEDSEGTINEVKQAAKRGIQTDVIGIGSNPVTIPDELNGKMVDDETGQIVYSALNEDMALEIAEAGKGIYVNASNDDAIDELEKHLGLLKKSAIQSSFLVTHDELYFPFVILAIVLVLVDFIITDKKNRWLDKINFFNKSTSIIFLCIILSSVMMSCADNDIEKTEETNEIQTLTEGQDSLKRIYSTEKEREFILRGNEYHRAGDYEKADSNYMAALGANNLSAVANHNLGVNLMNELISRQLTSPEGVIPDSISMPLVGKATDSFKESADPKIQKNNISSQAFYDLGNIEFIKENYQAAIDYYKEALRLNPLDDQARRNLRIAQLQRDENENNQQQQEQEQQDQEDQNNNSQPESQPEQQQQQDTPQINEQTSQQILDAAERKENAKRMQLHNEEAESTAKSGRSTKKW